MSQIPIIPLGSKIGFNNNVGTTGFTILSNATVTDPTGEGASVISTSIQDSSSGTGIQKIMITYVGTDLLLHKEIVTMNGISPINTTATDILFIESFNAIRIGSGQSAAGIVTLTSTDSLRLFAQIDQGNIIFKRALHYVIPGTQSALTEAILSCPTSGSVEFEIFSVIDNTPDGGGIVPIPIYDIILSGDAQTIHLRSPVICDATFSTQTLNIGILTKGISTLQTATACFHFQDIRTIPK